MAGAGGRVGRGMQGAFMTVVPRGTVQFLICQRDA
jgi:hypothetical protein